MTQRGAFVVTAIVIALAAGGCHSGAKHVDEPFHEQPGHFTMLDDPRLGNRFGETFAVSDGAALLYGGDNGRSRQNGGAVYFSGSTKATKVAPWPYPAPYQLGVVGIGGGRFIALGMPCPVPLPDPGADDGPDRTDCGHRLAAAEFDAATGRWTKLPAPNALSGLDAPVIPVDGLGRVGTKVFFLLPVGKTIRMAAYDLATRTWSAVALPRDYPPGRVIGPVVCFTHGRLVAVRQYRGQRVRTWVLTPALTWGPGSTQHVATDPKAFLQIDCTNELLLTTSSATDHPDVEHFDVFDAATRRWRGIPLRTRHGHETQSLTTAVRAADGTWLVWPPKWATPNIYTLARGSTKWTAMLRPTHHELVGLPHDILVSGNTALIRMTVRPDQPLGIGRFGL